jgi:ABC-type transport system involved in multi-copper enzyme maturation permease subunit
VNATRPAWPRDPRRPSGEISAAAAPFALGGLLPIVGYALSEALRRRIFTVVVVLTACFLVLFWLGTYYLFADLDALGPPPTEAIDTRTLAGATVLGLGMFATLFLGAVLAVFLTIGVVGGDAERGLLQPLVVRPVGRTTLLLARFMGAVAVCVPYTVVVFFASVLIVGGNGHYWPDRYALPALELAAGVALIAALAILGSVFLSSTANGIAIFMLFGAGLVAGLLGQIGHGLQSDRIERIAKVASWLAPFEALYQDALHAITENTVGFTRVALQLGPFGGAEQGGTQLRLWAAGYLLVVGGAALVAFARRDL